MMMYHQTKFVCHGINSSEAIAESYFDHISPHCDLDIEHTEQFFLHGTLAYDAASPYQVWLQNVLRFRRYHLDKHSLAFRTFAVTLTWNTVNQFFHRTLQLMMLYY